MWLVVASVASSLPVSFVKEYTKKKEIKWFSIISYLVLIYSYVQLVDHNEISVVYPMAKAISIIIVVASGIIIFNEKIDTMMLAIIGLIVFLCGFYCS
jgi:multidrug transporter EmrE-like cation transporter